MGIILSFCKQYELISSREYVATHFADIYITATAGDFMYYDWCIGHVSINHVIFPCSVPGSLTIQCSICEETFVARHRQD